MVTVVSSIFVSIADTSSFSIFIIAEKRLRMLSRPNGQASPPNRTWRDSHSNRTMMTISIERRFMMQDLSFAISAALEAERRRLAARLRENLIGQLSLIQAQIH